MELGLGINNFLPSLNSLGINSNNNSGSDLSDSILYSPLLNNDFTLISSALYKHSLIEPLSLFSDSTNDFKINTSYQVKTTPSFSEIRQGSVLKKGDDGESVKELQTKLSSLGFSVESTGYFGEKTEMKLKQFQKKYGIEQTGKLGKTTISKLDELTKPTSINSINKVGLGKPTPMGAKLATSAKREASRRNTVGMCYAGVATAVSRVFGSFLYGKSAYMAAGILAKNPKFKEIKVKASDLSKLSLGSIVVWGKTNVSPHGHISVAVGNGKEASDHLATQMTSLRGHQNFRVFTPMV